MTDKAEYPTDAIMIATGAWSREIISLLDASIPLMPGRGYSLTLEDEKLKVELSFDFAGGKSCNNSDEWKNEIWGHDGNYSN